jgi:hypothetical protein
MKAFWLGLAAGVAVAITVYRIIETEETQKVIRKCRVEIEGFKERFKTEFGHGR